jgi:hypothetical protein
MSTAVAGIPTYRAAQGLGSVNHVGRGLSMDWLTRMASALEFTPREILLGVAVFIVTSVGGALVVSWLLVKLPADYFCGSRSDPFWARRHPVIRWAGLIVKNFVGLAVVILGIVLSLPGVPGPGLLTIFIGMALLDFPGKRRLEVWLLNRPKVLGPINRLRQRYGKPPLVLPDEHSRS